MGNMKSLLLKHKYRELRPETIAELQNHEDVNFTRAEIEDWYREFQHHMNKGITRLTVDVFRTVYNRVFDGDASAFAYHLFRSFDLNGDGYVDFREFIIGLSVSGSDNPDKKLKWAFRVYDIDGNGQISKNEMNSILKDIHKMMNAAVSDELGSPEQITDRFFKEFDVNKDGQLNFQEFKNGALIEPLIIHLLECDPDP